MVDVKRRAHNARPYAKTEGDTVGAASSRPKSLPPTGGEGVTAYAVTDEGSFYPRPCPRGVLSCGAEPLSGILRMKTGGGKTRPYYRPGPLVENGGHTMRTPTQRLKGTP